MKHFPFEINIEKAHRPLHFLLPPIYFTIVKWLCRPYAQTSCQLHQLLAKDKVCFVADWDTDCSCCFSPAGTSRQVWKRCIFIHFL